MNVLPLSKQVEIISALCEGIGQRAVARLTDTDRKTVARLALRVGHGCAELHDRLFVGVRANRLELDEPCSASGASIKHQVRTARSLATNTPTLPCRHRRVRSSPI